LVFEDFSNIFEKIRDVLKSDNSNGCLHEDLCTFMIISRTFVLKIRVFYTKVIEKIKTRILCSITFAENRAIYEIMWKNMLEPGRPQVTIQYDTCALRAG
jgi:hypothetical protein